jgi:hypothetical protein
MAIVQSPFVSRHLDCLLTVISGSWLKAHSPRLLLLLFTFCLLIFDFPIEPPYCLIRFQRLLSQPNHQAAIEFFRGMAILAMSCRGTACRARLGLLTVALSEGKHNDTAKEIIGRSRHGFG